ncbi:MAG: hypothetical protein QXL86_02460 [Candidatus Aenigmatarchaeota archaeon]
MLNKILGAACLLGGILMVLFFPEIRDYQPEEIGFTGVVIGFGLIALGIYLLKT